MNPGRISQKIKLLWQVFLKKNKKQEYIAAC